MSRTRAGRTGDARRATGQGGIVVKRCQGCDREVLSAYRGAVTAVGKGEIEKVERNGDVIGRCACGRPVVWQRQLAHAKPTPTIRTG